MGMREKGVVMGLGILLAVGSVARGAEAISLQSIDEIAARQFELQGVLVRVRIQSRAKIEQISPERYQCRLYDETSSVLAEFPAAGYPWIYRLPVRHKKKRQNDVSFLVFYGIVRAGRHGTLELVGRKVQQNLDNEPEYGW